MKIIVSLLPGVFFLLFLLYYDSFKLVKVRYIIFCLIWGMLSAGFSYIINSYSINSLMIEFKIYSTYCAPIIEELIKSLFIIYLIKKLKIGFLIDAAIYGFTIGVAFSFVENLFYLYYLTSENILLWIIRGFGTAIMHCGNVSIFAIWSIYSVNKNNNIIKNYFPGLLLAAVLHSAYNQFFFSPALSSIFVILGVSITFGIIFTRNEKQIKSWIYDEFDSEIALLEAIKTGKFKSTKAGEYILKIKHGFKPEIIVDILAYIRIYLELSIRAKAQLMLRELSLTVTKDSAIKNKLLELNYLKKSIGKTGLNAISPILRLSHKDLWNLNTLE
jgi:protease PrsW